MPTTKKSLITISKDEAFAAHANAARAQTISKAYEERLNVCAMLSVALEEGGKHFAVNRKKFRNHGRGRRSSDHGAHVQVYPPVYYEVR